MPRETKRGLELDTLRQDVRLTVRTLFRNPGFTLIAVLILAIGIGATTALCCTINAALLEDLPYSEPERLIAGYKTRNGEPNGWVSIVDYFDFRELSQSFDDLAAVQRGQTVITGSDEPELVQVGMSTWNLFRTLGVQPMSGRSFLEEEEAESEVEGVLISHGLWQRRYASSPEVLGSTFYLDGSPVTVIGVLPPGFRFLWDAEIWRLIRRDILDEANRDAHSHWIVGRLKPGISLEQAQEEVSSIAAGLEEEYPDTNTGKGLGLIDLHGFMAWGIGRPLLMLMATAALVLLVACGNVAGLLLARGQGRLPEMATRAALGASRSRLVRQLLTETLVLTLAAGAVGIALAYAFQALLLRLLPLGDPGIPRPAIDSRALLFAVLISIVTGLLVGLVPAIRSTSVNLSTQMGRGGRSTDGFQGTRWRNGLVIVQVAVSVLLLIGSGLLIRSMANLSSVELGFEPDGLFTAGVMILPDSHPTPEEQGRLFSDVLEEVKTLPSVVSAAAINKLPVATRATDWPVWRADQPRPEYQDSRLALARMVSPGYFETMRMPIIKGRGISRTDVAGSPPVVVVSVAVAEELFPDEDPIGQLIDLGWQEQTFEIVGVVGNGRINGLRSSMERAMYMSPLQLDGARFMSFVVRTTSKPTTLTEPIRQILRNHDPDALLIDPKAMTTVIENDLAGFRVVLTSLGLLSLLALMLTAIGLYGVIAYHIVQRGNELGIRMAVGASSAELVGLVLKRGLVLVGAGLALGIAGALPVTRLLQQLLFEVEPLDLASYLAAGVFLSGVGLLACLVPALRVTRVDLAEVLRPE